MRRPRLASSERWTISSTDDVDAVSSEGVMLIAKGPIRMGERGVVLPEGFPA
jgi:hypothetical protein